MHQGHSLSSTRKSIDMYLTCFYASRISVYAKSDYRINTLTQSNRIIGIHILHRISTENNFTKKRVSFLWRERQLKCWMERELRATRGGTECVYCSVISFIQSSTDIVVPLADGLLVTLSSLVDPPSCSLAKVQQTALKYLYRRINLHCFFCADINGTGLYTDLDVVRDAVWETIKTTLLARTVPPSQWPRSSTGSTQAP
jgi:hypothetical protein